MSHLESESPTFDLQRFVEAQASTFKQARSELAAGQKRSHWMWFIFPQVQGLGSSSMARRYAIADLDEAIAYLNHPVLGPRLEDCTALVNAIQGRFINDIFGYPDDLKFHSSMTLFAEAATKSGPAADAPAHVFSAALSRYFNGLPDNATLARLRS